MRYALAGLVAVFVAIGVVAAEEVSVKEAKAGTPGQITLAMAKKMVGGTLHGGPNVRIFLAKRYYHYKPKERRVINDCSAGNPPIGYWYFHSRRTVWLSCNGLFLSSQRWSSRRLTHDNNWWSTHVMKWGCGRINRTIRRGLGPINTRRAHMPCRKITYVDGNIFRVTMFFNMCKHTHRHVLHYGVLASDGRVLKGYCDDTSNQSKPLKVKRF
jgi:hypothetical protein